MNIESDIRHRYIDSLFREAGIVMAYPQRDVHLDVTQPISLRVLSEDRDAYHQADNQALRAKFASAGTRPSLSPFSSSRNDIPNSKISLPQQRKMDLTRLFKPVLSSPFRRA